MLKHYTLTWICCRQIWLIFLILWRGLETERIYTDSFDIVNWFSENPICILLGYHSKFEWSPKTILDPVSWTNYLFTFVTMLFGQLGSQIICCESDSKVNFYNLVNSSWLTSKIESCLSLLKSLDFKILDSFEIYLLWVFQNCPCFKKIDWN